MSDFKTRFTYSETPYNHIGETLTQQQYKEQCDIQYLLTHYGEVGANAGILSGMLSGPRQPMFGDFSDVPDLQGTFDAVHRAEASFNALSANVKARFANNPVLLLDFVNDPANRAEAVKLGLIDETVKKTSVIQQVENVNSVNVDTLANNSEKNNPDKIG